MKKKINVCISPERLGREPVEPLLFRTKHGMLHARSSEMIELKECVDTCPIAPATEELSELMTSPVFLVAIS